MRFSLSVTDDNMLGHRDPSIAYHYTNCVSPVGPCLPSILPRAIFPA